MFCRGVKFRPDPVAPLIGLARQFAGEIGEKGQAGRKLRLLDIFIGLVRLIDRARTADDGGDARRLEMPRFGGEGHRDRPVGPGQPQRERLGDRSRLAPSGGASASISVAMEGPLT